MERPTPSDVMAKRDHERDMDLDKKIEALRRKNAALMRRYQEVEEDKKMAEEDVVTLQGRKGKADDLSITISKSTSESRVVVTKLCAVGGPQGAGSSRPGEGSLPGCGWGRKKQLTVTMAGKKGKRVVSERVEPGPPGDGVRGPDEDRQGQGGDAAGGAKHAHHPSSKRDAGATQECEIPPTCTDLTVPTSPEEQEEYLCWKRERERIDRERVARHKNAKGQWRRAWDVDKSESMFSDKCLPEKERGPTSRGGRNARRAHPRTHPQDSQGPVRDKVKDKGSKSVPVVSSKAKGKDRLTGRARRWDADEAGEPAQTADTSLEEFQEELDALTEPEDKEEDDVDDEGEDRKDRDHPKGKTSPGPEVIDSGDALSGPAPTGPEQSRGSSVCVPAAGGVPPQGKDGAVSSPTGPEQSRGSSVCVPAAGGVPPQGKDGAVSSPTGPEQSRGSSVCVPAAGGVPPQGKDGAVSSPTGPEQSRGSSVCVPAAGGVPPQGKDGAVSSPRGTEKRVRFSEELIKGAVRATAAEGLTAPQPPLPLPREVGEVGEAGEASSPGRRTQRESDDPQEVVQSPRPGPSERAQPVVRQQVPSPTEHGEKNSDPPPAEQSGGSRQESSEGPTEHAKFNISNRNTEELIDAGLSVLSLESRDTCSTATTNTDKARENGKIV